MTVDPTYRSLDRIPKDPARRIFVIGDPRETNVLFRVQRLYFDGVVARGHNARLIPLERARAPRFHSLGISAKPPPTSVPRGQIRTGC